MDVGSEYIKMCEKAPRELTEYTWSDTRQYVVCCYHRCLVEYDEGYHDWRCDAMEEAQDKILYEGKYTEHGRDSLWGKLQKSDDWCQGKHWIKLLTQDQLQAMVRTVYLYELIGCFTNWYDNEVAVRGLAQFDNASMEQLWLAFVMKELYSKKWSKGEWVNE